MTPAVTTPRSRTHHGNAVATCVIVPEPDGGSTAFTANVSTGTRSDSATPSPTAISADLNDGRLQPMDVEGRCSTDSVTSTIASAKAQITPNPAITEPGWPRRGSTKDGPIHDV